jgi:hypothetical protein
VWPYGSADWLSSTTHFLFVRRVVAETEKWMPCPTLNDSNADVSREIFNKSISSQHKVRNFTQDCPSQAWDRCYDFLNIFAEKFSEKLAFLTQNKAKF